MRMSYGLTFSVNRMECQVMCTTFGLSRTKYGANTLMTTANLSVTCWNFMSYLVQGFSAPILHNRTKKRVFFSRLMQPLARKDNSETPKEEFKWRAKSMM